MATVIALTSFTGVLSKDVLGEARIEEHSEFPNQPSVFPGGKYFENGKLQPVGSVHKTVKKAGETIKVFAGQRLDSSHPAVKKWPELFGQPDDVRAQAAVEQATRSPGEKRP